MFLDYTLSEISSLVAPLNSRQSRLHPGLPSSPSNGTSNFGSNTAKRMYRLDGVLHFVQPTVG